MEYHTYLHMYMSSTFWKTQKAPFKNPKVYASYTAPTWHLQSTADRIDTSICLAGTARSDFHTHLNLKYL